VPRALISVHDKHGVARVCAGAAKLGWELVSSGGTAAHLEERGRRGDDGRGGHPGAEMLGGPGQTLHPRIHAGILARPESRRDVQTLAAHEIEPFDLVCVNLYRSPRSPQRRSATEPRWSR